MIFQAHKGVSTENPENTMPAFIAASEQGYKIIELDVSVTKDTQFVLLHDETINRTARNLDGSEIEHEIKIGDITYAKALQYDFGIAFSQKFAGTKITLFADVLKFAKQKCITLKIDSKYLRFTESQLSAFFELLRPYQDVACLTCNDISQIEYALQFLPEMNYHYDGAVSEEILLKLSKSLPRERLTVWLPHKNPSTWWVSVEYANRQNAELIKKYAHLGVWILSDYSQLSEAEELGAEIIETNGQLKPEVLLDFIPDMHTHSEFSHDSECKIKDMCRVQSARGTKMFAVTDHFDTFSYNDYDIFTPFKNASREIDTLNTQVDVDILKGIEIGEGFWHLDSYKKIVSEFSFDVIIGSVHFVKYNDINTPYSHVDFSKFTDAEIDGFLNHYFDDIITMLKTEEMDILAHLTCPLRYIVGKYNRKLDVSKFSEKIDYILKFIIENGIALEVNTSSFSILNDFLPSTDILKKYREMGGYLLTLGSDAHIAENASLGIDKAINMLKEIGFKNVFYYKGRKAYQITI